MAKLAAAALAVLLGLAPSRAHGVSVATGLSYDHLTIGEEAAGGFGADLYVRPHTVLEVLEPELRVGWHQATRTGEALLQEVRVTTRVTPALLGARVGLTVGGVTPWVGAHAGWARVAVDYSGFADDHSGFAFDVGGGLELSGLRRLGLALAAWWMHLPSNTEETLRLVTVGLEAKLAL